MDKLNNVYYKELTKEEFAYVNNINVSIVENVYNTMDVTKATTYDILKFIVDNNYGTLALNNIQNTINESYAELIDKNVFKDTGEVNETTIAAMNLYIASCEDGTLDLSNEIVKQTYTKYKTILAELNKATMMNNYPFITEEVADMLLNGKNTLPNYLIIQAISVNNIASTYGGSLQATINAKYNEIPLRDENITKAYSRYNYGIDNDTLNDLYQSGNVTNGTLIKYLSEQQYFIDEDYQNDMQNKFNASYEAFSNFESDDYMPRSSEDSFKAINEISDYIYGEYDDTKLVSETFVYSQIKEVYNKDILVVNIISFVAILLIIAFTFKSAFTPILLTILIQGAIWVTMGISTMMGNEIFFICYIVVMCVQMGATIDYGILLTNNYINNRKKYGVMDSMSLALSSSITTILTSGSILILATLIIGLVSKVSIVSDLGLLLSRGCLISILMIIFVLPQCLMICDKLIEKTSYKTKFYDGEDETLLDNEETKEEE